MLSVSSYDRSHIDGCRARLEDQLASYRTDPAGFRRLFATFFDEIEKRYL